MNNDYECSVIFFLNNSFYQKDNLWVVGKGQRFMLIIYLWGEFWTGINSLVIDLNF